MLEKINTCTNKCLELIECNNNKISDLPNLPQTLKELYCEDNDLAYLPELPATLRILSCQNNENLTRLPNLPIKLKKLICDKAILDYYGILPRDGIQTKIDKINCRNYKDSLEYMSDYIMK
jgi:E3 ubiquitin-protein ligase SspH2